MAAGPWKVYDSAKPVLSRIGVDTFKCALFSSSYTPAQTDDSYTGLSGEVANGNGYTTGGATLTGVTFADVAGVTTFLHDDITFTATGGDIGPGRYAVIYNYTDSGKQLVAQCLLDSTPANVTIPSGSPLIISGASGVLKLTGGW